MIAVSRELSWRMLLRNGILPGQGVASRDIKEKLRGFSCGASHRRTFSGSSNHSYGEEKLNLVEYLDKAK